MQDNARAWDGRDGELLRAVADDRDPDAFRALFDRYQPRVFVFVLRRVEDHELAREITSDVFLEVWSGASSFRGDSKISSWVFGIARFKCLEAIRGRARLKRSRVISTDDEVISQVPEARLPVTHLDARDELARVAELLQRLPREQREAIEWTIVQGRSIDEVARQQNVSRDTVKTRISRARRSLKRLLGRTAEDGTTDGEGDGR